jgi:hypothetical protein
VLPDGTTKNPEHQAIAGQSNDKNNPFTNEELPAQSQYNKYAAQKLQNMNAPLNKTLPSPQVLPPLILEQKH